MTPQNDDDAVPCRNYCTSHIPRHVMKELEAGAFRKLCEHLRERSDAVANIDLMSISGFCRNCLAKWLVVEARRVSEEMNASEERELSEEERRVIVALDALGYDEAAEEVYGCGYPEWKKRYNKKATEEQMAAYKASTPIQAKHDKSLLQKRASQPATLTTPASGAATSLPPPPSKSLLSDVCCQNVDTPSTATAPTSVAPPSSSDAARRYTPPAPPSKTMHLLIGIVTVSDRAYAKEYETGDLSGPAVENAVRTALLQLSSSSSHEVTFDIVETTIVPDDRDQIAGALQRCGNEKRAQLIFTTGGTGFSPRDVTPEATLSVLDRECRGLLPWASQVLSEEQPMACLSRGVCGVLGTSLVVNLPGNPGGVRRLVELLMPLLLHAVLDLEME